MIDKSEKSEIESLLREVWPQSSSFGFNQTTFACWDDSFIRISVRLESKQTLEQAMSEINTRLNALKSQQATRNQLLM